ncbi:MAG: hypothetical protein AAF360_14420, partial [Pseudomonadota bacterium]
GFGTFLISSDAGTQIAAAILGLTVGVACAAFLDAAEDRRRVAAGAIFGGVVGVGALFVAPASMTATAIGVGALLCVALLSALTAPWSPPGAEER